MFSGTEDDDLFNPEASSKLASLFSTHMKPLNTNGNQSLIYTAPKQPKPETAKSQPPKPAAQTQQNAVLCAKAVILYKQSDGKYVSCGAYGFALTGSHTTKIYELIVYKDKQNIIARAKLLQTFTFTLEKNNFASFYDDSKQNWLVYFSNSTDYDGFIKELQKCGITIVDNTKIAETPQPDQVQEEAQLQHPIPESSVKEATENEPENSEAALKASILSRMAKMGQPILPSTKPKTSVSDDVSDSDSSEIVASRKLPRKPKRSNNNNGNEKYEQDPVTSTQQTASGIAVQSVVPIIPTQSSLPHYYGSAGISTTTTVYDPLNIILAENRSQNTEIRMNLSQLSNKLDEVMWKMNHSETSVAEERLMKAKIKALEIKVDNLTKELEESINANIELERKVAGAKLAKSDKHWEDIVEQKDAEIKELIKELSAKEARIKEMETAEKNVADYKSYALSISCSPDPINLNDFESFYDQHKEDKDFLRAVYTSLFEKLNEQKTALSTVQDQSAEKVDCPIENKVDANCEIVDSVMSELYNHIVKHVDQSSGTVLMDFFPNGLQKCIKTCAKLIKQELKKGVCSNSENAFDAAGN